MCSIFLSYLVNKLSLSQEQEEWDMLSLARRDRGIFKLVLNIPNVTAIDSRSHKPGVRGAETDVSLG